MKLSKHRISIIAAVTMFIILVLYNIITSHELRKNGIVVVGEILDYAFAAKSTTMDFQYKFRYHNKEYRASSPGGVRDPKEFIGKSFPIIFSERTKKSQILITPAHFTKYKIKYPDSLLWVIQYLK